MVFHIFHTWYPYTDTRELHMAERPLPFFSTRGHHLWLSTELGSLSHHPIYYIEFIPSVTPRSVPVSAWSTVCLMALPTCGPCTPIESSSCVHLHSDVSFEAPSLSNIHLEKYEHTRARTERNTQYSTPKAASDLRICLCLFQNLKNIFFS